MGSTRGDEHKKPCSLGEGTGPKGSANSEAPQRATASRLVPTHHSIDPAKLREFLDRRVTDGVVRKLIDKWLKAGVLEDGQLHYPDTGTPQGGVVTPRTQKVTSGLSV